MGFLSRLFGNKIQELHDEQLGLFRKLKSSGSEMIWKGSLNFLDNSVSTFIIGNETNLDNRQKGMLLDILNNSFDYSNKSNDALRIEFENAQKEYSIWSDHFECISISTINNHGIITFQENETFMHFNVIFDGNNVIDVSIDN